MFGHGMRLDYLRLSLFDYFWIGLVIENFIFFCLCLEQTKIPVLIAQGKVLKELKKKILCSPTDISEVMCLKMIVHDFFFTYSLFSQLRYEILKTRYCNLYLGVSYSSQSTQNSSETKLGNFLSFWLHW